MRSGGFDERLGEDNDLNTRLRRLDARRLYLRRIDAYTSMPPLRAARLCPDRCGVAPRLLRSTRPLRGRPLTTNSPPAERPYVPAAGHDWLLPFYDPISKLLGTESAHRELVEQAHLLPGQRVLEIGCGTGNLTMLVKKLHPAVDVVGLDPDPKALDRARRKADRQRVSVALDRGYSGDLPYPDGSYDRVLSALMFHHLDRDEKSRTLHQVRRVLRPGGSLHVLDFGGSLDRADGFLARLFHRSEHLRDNSRETILGLMQDAGFVDAGEVAQRPSLFGRMSYYRASR